MANPLAPSFIGASVYSSEIDLWWHNDPQVNTVWIYPTGQVGGSGFNFCPIRGLAMGTTYTFWIENWAPGFITGGVPVTLTTHRSSAQTFMVQAEVGSPGNTRGSFDLLVPKQTFIAHYSRSDETTILQGPWNLVDTLTLPGGDQPEGTALSLIQSFLTPEGFQAIAVVKPQKGSDVLVSYQFTPASGQHNPIPVISDHGPIDQVTGSPALAQTDQSTFQLFVPRAGGIYTYTHTSKAIEGNWTSGTVLQPPANTQVVAIALIQTDGLGGLVVVAQVKTAQGVDTLVTYQFTAGAQPVWTGPLELVTNQGPITGVSGSPVLIQSNEGIIARFDLLVPIDGVLSYFIHSSGQIQGPWSLITTLRPANNNSQIKAVAVSLVQDDQGNLEAVARVAPPQGANFMVAYQFKQGSGWSDPVTLVDEKGQVITPGTE